MNTIVLFFYDDFIKATFYSNSDNLLTISRLKWLSKKFSWKKHTVNRFYFRNLVNAEILEETGFINENLNIKSDNVVSL